MSDAVGRHLRFLATRDTTWEIRTLPPEAWSPQRHATLVHFVFPNSIFVYHPDYISHLGMYPDAADQLLQVRLLDLRRSPTGLDSPQRAGRYAGRHLLAAADRAFLDPQ